MTRMCFAACIAASALCLTAAAPPPLTIVVDKRGTCSGSAVGHGRQKIAEFEAQKLRRQAEREGRAVRVIELRDDLDGGALRTSEGLLTDARIVRPVC